MAITFSGDRQLKTASNRVVWNKQTACSLSFLFRYEVAGGTASSVVNNCRVVSRQYDEGLAAILTNPDSSPGEVDLKAQVKTGTPKFGGATSELAQGSTYHVAIVYKPGDQRCYINGIGAWMSSHSEPTKDGGYPFILGGTPSGGPCIFTIGDVAAWNGYALSQADVNALRDGELTPAQVGTAAPWRGWWTLEGTPGQLVAAGDPGIRDSLGGQHLTVLSGGGEARYAEALSFEPEAEIRSAYVATSGRTVAVYFKSIATGLSVLAKKSITLPTIAKDGVTLGALRDPWITGYHDAILYRLPEGASASPGDSVITLDAPAGWMDTAAGVTAPLDNFPIDNRSGRSSFGVESLERTMKVGINMSQSSNYIPHYIARDWVKKAVTFTQCTLDASGKPTAMDVNPVYAAMYGHINENGIDATGYPGPTGLFAVGWDDLDPAHPTSFYLGITGGNTTTRVSERKDLANPGVTGKGQVRVFDVQRNPSSTSVKISFYLHMSNAALAPRFDNLVVYGPGDFEYADGTPTVLDRSDPYAFASSYLERHYTGLATTRWLDATNASWGSPDINEPEYLHRITDFCWGGGFFRKSQTQAYVEARPFVPAGSYLYSAEHGDPYTATLGSDIDAEGTVLDITDAATAPVIYGVDLVVDSEVMRVRSVAGTSVTVYRGQLGTAAVPHDAGAIQVNGRLAFNVLDDVRGGTLVTEFVTQSPHNLKTGNGLSFGSDSTLPALTYAGGISYAPAQARIVFVTGASTFVTSFYHAGAPAPVTLAAPVAMDPATHKTFFYSAKGAAYPYAFQAKATAAFPGTNYHLIVGHAASDAMVDHIAREARDNFPAGRKVIVELTNEAWNTFFTQCFHFHTISRLRFPGENLLASYVVRLGEVIERFRAIFDEGGAGRAGEIMGVFSVGPHSPGDTQALLAIARGRGIKFYGGGLSLAPYIDADTSQATKAASVAYDHRQCADLYIHDIRTNTSSSGWPAYFAAHRQHLAAHEAESGERVTLSAYEGDTQYTLATRDDAKMRDMMYDPAWYWVAQEYYALLQENGFDHFTEFTEQAEHYNGTNWPLYHWWAQDHGRGDGSDGKADNRLTLAQPGFPNSKDAATNLDGRQVSVRGQASIAWNSAAPGG